MFGEQVMVSNHAYTLGGYENRRRYYGKSAKSYGQRAKTTKLWVKPRLRPARLDLVKNRKVPPRRRVMIPGAYRTQYLGQPMLIVHPVVWDEMKRLSPT